MKPETRTRIIKALAEAYGNATDDAHRARVAFRGQDLSKEHGQSGRTRGELLAEYEAEETATYEALIDFDPTWKKRLAFGG